MHRDPLKVAIDGRHFPPGARTRDKVEHRFLSLA